MNEKITLHYGNQQLFRNRNRDINISGRFNNMATATYAYYTLNKKDSNIFYIKSTNKQLDQISKNRLRHKCFNIEIPTNSPALKIGQNIVDIYIGDRKNDYHCIMSFDWSNELVPLPLDIIDLSKYSSIQNIGQAINGKWEIDKQKNVIRSIHPPQDALFLLGSAHYSQEATYCIRFHHEYNFAGCSDFFVQHEDYEKPFGIKPGWSSAGLVTLGNYGKHFTGWLSYGDLLKQSKYWVVKTRPVRVNCASETIYKVRHRIILNNGINQLQAKIWKENAQEPNWMIDISHKHTDFNKASFGLFQFAGRPTEWFDIHVKSLN